MKNIHMLILKGQHKHCHSFTINNWVYETVILQTTKFWTGQTNAKAAKMIHESQIVSTHLCKENIMKYQLWALLIYTERSSLSSHA